MKRVLVLGVAVLLLGACSSSSKSSRPPATTLPPITSPPNAVRNGWTPAALASAKKLADLTRSKGVACNGYNVISYTAVAADYQKTGLPLPGAMTQCTSAGGENLTFETFANVGDAYQYMGDKISIICRSAQARKAASPTFPYVASTTWFVEPDAQATADRIAPLIGGISRTGRCPQA
jgi:hypothetical protein